MVNIPPGNLDKLEEKKFLNEKNETKENIDKTLKNKSFKKIIIENFCLDDEDLKDEYINKIFNFFENYSENDEEIKKGILYFGEKVNFEKNFLKKIFYENVNSKEKKFFFVEYVLFYKIYGEKKIEKIFDFLRIDVIDLFDRFLFLDVREFLKLNDSEEIIDYFLESFPKLEENKFKEKDFLEDFRNFIFSFRLKDKIILNEQKGFEENIKKYGRNIGFCLPDNFLSLRERKIIPNHEIADFLYKWIFNSNYIFVLQELGKFDFTSIYAYFLKYKRKSFVYFLDILNISYKNDFEFDYGAFNELEKLLYKKNYDGLIEFSKKFKISEKIEKQLKNAFYHKNDEIIYKILGEIILLEFENFYKIGILELIYHNYFYEGFKIEDGEYLKKMNNKDFLECSKICLNSNYNASLGLEILMKYLKGDFDNLEDFKIYDTKKNKKWFKKLSKKQQKIWLSKNRGEYEVSGNNTLIEKYLKKNLFDTIYKASKIIKNINLLGFNLVDTFENYLDFEKYFTSPLNTEFLEFKNFCRKNNEESEKLNYAKTLLNKLLFEIEKINNLLLKELEIKISKKNLEKGKKIKRIIIEKELNPLRMLQMGNLVDGSCLSYYNQNGYYYATIANTVDINKGVFYIYDENEELIGRVLVTIGNDKKLTRYKMYYKGNVNVYLNYYFDEYFKKLAEKMGMEINGSENEVQLIEGEEWYKDGEYFVI